MSTVSPFPRSHPRASPAARENAAAHEALAAFIGRSRRLLVLTGAGCSTESGIPDYRDGHGEWKHARPVQLQDFLKDPRARQRYWGRSLSGWPRVASASPNAAHHALARLEASGRVHCLITQNVDGLHQKAGSRNVIDLHGRLERVICLGCGEALSRATVQRTLEHLNPGWRERSAGRTAPDGDVHLEGVDYSRFRVPDCRRCAGLLKPDVVFFGESVPRERVAGAFAALETADALLVVGSSLMVWSGYRFVRGARERGLPVAVLNLGRTRADGDGIVKIEARCGDALGSDLASVDNSPCSTR